ncbi:MAG: AAA family ATPase [Solirubrobacteraceae bacterium]|nr:AAA family ATPase [Solirubrobacteraceae bacterium]
MPEPVLPHGAFVPADVRRSLHDGTPRPERRRGSVLIADVSGFSAVTEELAQSHGARRGAEEVAALLDQVYGPLVAEVDQAGGTVVAFAGDAVICCFDGDDGISAVACGLRMQAGIAGAASTQISVAVATGSYQRLTVGDPAVRLHELLAGEAVALLATISADAAGGRVVVDVATAGSLPGLRTGAAGEGSVEVLGLDETPVVPDPTPAPVEAGTEAATPWIPHWLRDRPSLAGELRTVVALFVRLEGLDADRERLDAAVRAVHATVGEFGGAVFDLVVDDKGTYLSVGFGAPRAHDDDPQRAAATALALRDGSHPAAIGMTRGRMYAGTYGGATRRTFGLQGTRANLAARLMQAARPGEILIEEPLATLLEDRWELLARPAMRMKGFGAPVAMRALTGTRDRAPATARGPALVDREDERARLDDLLAGVLDGDGAVVVLEGEPGIGKSRLVRHLAERATDREIAVHDGAGDPIARGAPYHGWRTVFSTAEPLGALPGDDTTAQLEGEARAEAVRDALATRLLTAAAGTPTLVVLEDAHWLDSASLALATRVAADPGALLLVVTTRPLAEVGHPALERLCANGVERLRVGPLGAADARTLAALAAGVDLPETTAELIGVKAGGNPLFTRELAVELRDRGPGALDDLEASDSVEAVIASRVDRLGVPAQSILKVASVLGRTFSSATLRALADGDIEAELAGLEERNLLGPEGAGRLAFRHALIRDVVYEQLLFAQRRELHRRAAEALERTDDEVTDAALGHHWEHAGVPGRAAGHYAAEGRAAFHSGAFGECVTMLDRALELDDGGLREERAELQWQVAQACYRLGELERCHEVAQEAIAALDRPVPAGSAGLVGASVRELAVQTAHHALRGHLLRPVKPAGRDRLRLAAESQRMMAEVYYLSSDTARSSYVVLRALNLSERLGPSRELAEAYGAIGIIFGLIGVHGPAERYGTMAIDVAEDLQDEFTIAITLHQRCMYRSTKGPYDLYADDYERSIEGFRRLGHKPRLRDALGIAAIGDHLFGRPDLCAERMRELLSTVEPQEASLGEAWAHTWLGATALRRGDLEEALEHLRTAGELSQTRELDMTSVDIVALTALALRRSGDAAGARREEEAAWAVLEKQGRRPAGHAVLDGYVALAELAFLRWDEARSPLDRLRARRGVATACKRLRTYARAFAIGAPARWLYEGERLWRLGRHDKALAAWEHARESAAGLDMRHDLALAHAALGDHLPDGSAEREAHRAQAAEMLAELGEPPDSRAVAPLDRR